MFEDETPVAWSALRPHTAVVAAGGADIGTVHEVRGDAEEDIFHSVLVKRASDGTVVEVPAARITRLTEHHVVTDLGEDEASSLDAYRAA